MNKDETKYTHGRTCVYNINYHIIWSTKYRNKWMTVALEDEIKQILHDIAAESKFCIEHLEIGLDDHVHLLISAPPKLSVTAMVKCLKGTSSFRLFRLHPELKQLYQNDKDRHIWSPSYFVESIGTTNSDAVAKYIDEHRNKERKYDSQDA